MAIDPARVENDNNRGGPTQDLERLCPTGRVLDQQEPQFAGADPDRLVASTDRVDALQPSDHRVRPCSERTPGHKNQNNKHKKKPTKKHDTRAEGASLGPPRQPSLIN